MFLLLHTPDRGPIRIPQYLRCAPPTEVCLPTNRASAHGLPRLLLLKKRLAVEFRIRETSKATDLGIICLTSRDGFPQKLNSWFLITFGPPGLKNCWTLTRSYKGRRIESKMIREVAESLIPSSCHRAFRPDLRAARRVEGTSSVGAVRRLPRAT